jgi:hypothetical protein
MNDDGSRGPTRWGVRCRDGQILWVDDEPAADRVFTSLVGAERLVRRSDRGSEPTLAGFPMECVPDAAIAGQTHTQAASQPGAGRGRGRSTYVIRADGDVDFAVVDALQTASFAAGDADLPILVVLDLTHVVSWDPRVPTALLRLRRHLLGGHGVLLLRGASPQLQTELALTGLNRVFVDADQPAPPAPPGIGGHAV